MNILEHPFETSFQTAPFSKIKTEDFLPAVRNAIKSAKAEIEAITSNTESPNFKNTIIILLSSFFLLLFIDFFLEIIF